MDKDWQKTFALMKNKQDPVVAKLLTWIYATETSIPVEAGDLVKFMNENPDWPRLSEFREKIEKNIGSSRLRPHEIADWFRQNPPQSYEGMKACMAALQSLGLTDEAKKSLVTFWAEAGLEKNETAAIAQIYRAYFSEADHARRLDDMLWEGRISEAKDMLPFVTGGTRKLAETRMALARQSLKSNLLLLEVPASLRNNEGLLFEQARQQVRKGHDDAARAFIDGVKIPFRHPDMWWSLQNILSRRAIEDHDFARAHDIVSRHQLKDGIEYAQAEWLLGWLDLRFLKKPGEAYRRFDALYAHVQSAISRARTAYWAARAAQ